MATCIFAPVISDEEWQTVPSEIGQKITKFVEEKFEELITAKALSETKSHNAEQTLAQLKETNENLLNENESLKSKLETAKAAITELEAQAANLTSELAKVQSRCNELESEAAEFRHQRNLAIDERDENVRMIQRRNAEVERMQTEITTLTQQLEVAINAKCEALAQNEEIGSMKMTLEYREKRLDQERARLDAQIDSLTSELNDRTDELLNMRRDNTSRCIQLETKLNEKSQELEIATEQIRSLMELNSNLSDRNEELSQKMLNQRETEAKMSESYVCEIEAKTKMANAYKSMCEENQKHAEELKEALTEVQQLLKTATEQYGDLETKHKESELMHEELMIKKNECIAMLKKELETANDLLDQSKQDLIHQDREGISLSSAPGSRLNKSGMSYSECYSRYVAVSEQLTNKQEECARLDNYISCIVKEIEEKGPLIKKLREEYSATLDANDALKASNDALMAELQQIRETSMENRKTEGQVSRENARLKKEVADLSRQVVHLLQEVEHSRAGSSSASTDNDLSDSISSADIISKRLVTFNDISELQSTNQKLLALVRELTERQEEVESFDPAAVANMKLKLDELRASHNEFLEEREQQNKMMAILRNQRDMYKNWYTQAQKGAGEEIPLEHRSFAMRENGDGSKMQTESESSHQDDKTQDLEGQIDKLKKQIDQLKEENETYRKEKSDNEKILLEQMENMRSEIKDLTRQNCKLSSQAEMHEEKFKILNNNTEIYKKQISGLEKQNKIYSESIIKHEQAVTYLKDETIQSQTKLSKAEVMLGHLQKENALLKDAEGRLLKERELLKRESHQQNLLQTNIELIKATIERRDAEERLKLESRLEDAHRECSALRRRLQEEQNHFRQLAENLERQTQQAQKRAEEERLLADNLRKELAEARDELTFKTGQIEDLSKKLKSSVFSEPESYSDGRRIRELEQQLFDANAEISSLKSNLKSAKEASEEYLNMAQSAENQVKDITEREDEMLRTIEEQKSRIKVLEEKCSELEGELSIQMDDQDMANASVKSKSHQLQEELNVKTMDLKTAREQLENARSEIKSLNEQLKAVENKYAREVTLHSVDLQALTDMKEELAKAVNEIKELIGERDQARDALIQSRAQWEEQQKLFEREKEELQRRFEDMDTQNATLLDQIQALSDKLTVLQSQVSGDSQNTSTSGEVSFNRSLIEDDVNSSEQLLKIIKYLRQEKDIAVSKADIIEAEHFRLKSQFETLTKQLEESKAQLELERQKSEVSVVSAAKHSEVLRKLETLNAITDSNRALRQERDALLSEITDLRTRAHRLDTEVAPLQEKNRELSTKAEQLQSENISLRAECTRWRQRANTLIEKTNRTSPEDWKKLQTERETLAKHLTIERANTTKLNDEVNNLRQDKSRMEEQLKSLRAQSSNQTEEINALRSEVSSLQAQITQINQALDQQIQNVNKFTEENRILTEDTAGKDVTITELKNNLAQVKKIAKKYKNQYEDQVKDIEALKLQSEQKETEQNSNAEKQRQLMEEQRSEHEERMSQIESTHKEAMEQLNQQVSGSSEQIESLKKEIESLKQVSLEKEEKFKTLFKNAKERIVSLTEQNNNLKEELRKQEKSDSSDNAAGEGTSVSSNANNADLTEKLKACQREKDEIAEKSREDKEKSAIEIEALLTRVNQLQRQLGLQQGSKPSTSSASSEKTSMERPTADIKPMAGHSTNTQTQSVPIQPWRSGGEPPLASIRPMSQQLRTVAVLPTSQTPSAVMVPPQQQVHTTGSSTIEALSSSPTSSHTDYVPATSSASPAMLGPRQVAVPPTQSSQDTEDDEGNNVPMQTTTQSQSQQAVALVLPRVEPPCSGSGPTQEQGTSSSSSNTVTTTQAGLKRQREPDTDSSCQSEEPSGKLQQQSKRTRIQQTGTVTDSGLEVEYQVPTSSQRDHDDDNVIVVESDDEGGADEGEGADDDQDDPDTEGYDMEGMEQDTYEDADCQDVEDEEEGGNEVEVIEDSSEVPNQSESQESPEEEGNEQAQSEAISSGTDGTGRSVPTTPLQSSPQESIPGGDEHHHQGTSTQLTHSDEIPSVIISGEVDDENRGEGSSEECMRPPNMAGTSSEGGQLLGEHEEELEGDDGVSSEGEKPPTTEEGEEEEGREAEASPSTNTRSRNVRGGPVARRANRPHMVGGPRSSRSGPTPIVWNRDQRNTSPIRQQHPQGDRNRGGSPSFASRAVARRARGRLQRPFGGRF